MQMHKSEKEAAIKQLNERFVRAKSAVLAEFSKLDVAAVTQLRKKCRDAGVEYRVIKNTLAKRAAKGTPLESLSDDFTGSGVGAQLRGRNRSGEDPDRLCQRTRCDQAPRRHARGAEARPGEGE